MEKQELVETIKNTSNSVRTVHATRPAILPKRRLLAANTLYKKENLLNHATLCIVFHARVPSLVSPEKYPNRPSMYATKEELKTSLAFISNAPCTSVTLPGVAYVIMLGDPQNKGVLVNLYLLLKWYPLCTWRVSSLHIVYS